MILSFKESVNAIDTAKKALGEHDEFWLGNPGKVESEFYTLGLLSVQERFMAVDIALREVTAADRRGPSRPGDRASHPPFRGEKMYAFKWMSQEFGKEMHFKFGLPTDSMGVTRLAVYSFHESDG